MPQSNIDVILRVINSRRFQSEMYSAGRAVNTMSGSFGGASRAASGLAAATAVVESGMYAIGTASHIAGYGIAALAAATVFAGVKFNATMEGNVLAFEHFAGGAQQATKFTKQLFDIARSSPFSFEDITMAARRFLAFGFNVKETTGLLKTMADTISFTGGGTDEILRFAKALGDIRAKGRLMQQEMNQLANLNIPIRDILSKGGLELTQKQLMNIGRAGIPADQAIQAIYTGLNKIYGGGAQKYLETFNGQWQRLADNLRVAAGDATKQTGIFAFLKNQLKSMNQTVEGKKGLPDWLQSIINFMPKLGGAIAVGFGVAKGFVMDFIHEMSPMQPFLKNVVWPLAIGIAKGLAGSIKVAVGIMAVFARILGVIGNLAAPFKGVFQAIGMVIAFVFGGEILKAISLIGKFGGVFRLIGFAARLLLAPVRMVGAAFEGLSGLIFRVLNPGAITGLVSSMVAALNRFLPQFLQVGAKLATAFVKGLATMVEKIGSALFRGLAAAFIWALNKAIGIFNAGIKVYNKIPLAPDIDPIQQIKGFARGGYITSGGSFLVGENGPEIVRAHAGASIHPLRPASGDNNQTSASPMFEGAGDMAVIHANMPVYIGRRQVGEIQGEYLAERKARR